MTAAEFEGLSEMELAQKVRIGQNGAYDEIVKRYMQDAYHFSLKLTGNRSEADELSQEGFVRAYAALQEFRGQSQFRSWLFTILVNCYRDTLRRRKRWTGRLERMAPEVRSTARDETDRVEAEELRALIDRRIQELPDRQREVLLLHLCGDLNYTEIGKSLGISPENVKVNLSLARKRLKDQLKSYID